MTKKKTKMPKKKIRLLINLPISKMHGAKKGRVFEVTRETKGLYMFIGDEGVECGAYPIECELII